MDHISTDIHGNKPPVLIKHKRRRRNTWDTSVVCLESWMAAVTTPQDEENSITNDLISAEDLRQLQEINDTFSTISDDAGKEKIFHHVIFEGELTAFKMTKTDFLRWLMDKRIRMANGKVKSLGEVWLKWSGRVCRSWQMLFPSTVATPPVTTRS